MLQCICAATLPTEETQMGDRAPASDYRHADQEEPPYNADFGSSSSIQDHITWLQQGRTLTRA
jgi:hypothetical protein